MKTLFADAGAPNDPGSSGPAPGSPRRSSQTPPRENDRNIHEPGTIQTILQSLSHALFDNIILPPR